MTTGQCFSPGTLVSCTNKTDHHDITEILLNVHCGVKHHKPKPNINLIWSLLILSQTGIKRGRAQDHEILVLAPENFQTVALLASENLNILCAPLVAGT